MRKFFVKYSNKRNDNQIIIDGTDYNHIKNVLRMNVGDKINIGIIENEEKVLNVLCEIESFEKEYILCNIIEELKSVAESDLKVTIYQGIPKAEKMELIIQKTTELGIYSIIPTNMKRCVVKVDTKAEGKKIDRWQKIVEVAAKQCARDMIPKIDNVINIKNICKSVNKYDIVLVAYENEEENSIKKEIEELKRLKKSHLNIAIVIGPEGGIDQEEIDGLKESGAKIITLGKRILRTETVGLTLLSILMYELGDLN